MKRILAISLCAIILAFAACGGQTDVAPDTASVRYENLEKLGRFWGYVKYTHHRSVSGQLCWDEELLNLIPIIYNAATEDVDGILNDWFVGLMENEHNFEPWHDFDLASYIAEMAEELAYTEAYDGLEAMLEMHGTHDVLAETREFVNYFTAMVEDGNEFDWLSFVEMVEEMFPLISPMVSAYFQMTENTIVPVTFNSIGVPRFDNQRSHPRADFSDPGFRLLGLFRMWNAMRYYYPHLDILDVDWDDLLIEYISKMLDGTDRHSYELTLAALSHHLRDSAHLTFFGSTFFANEFGHYVIPVQLIAAEGRLVVYEVLTPEIPLIVGDVILGLNGRDIDEIAAEMLRLLPYPTEEKALSYLAGRFFGGTGWHSHHPLRSHSEDIEIDVMRDSIELSLTVRGSGIDHRFSPPADISHVLLDGNIGLINPSMLSRGILRYIMDEFAETEGIVIDIRQSPGYMDFMVDMRQYLMEWPQPFAILSSPSQRHPGERTELPINQGFIRRTYAFAYDAPVVLLMDERTISHMEWMIMAFRVAPNVTVMGPYSMGTNGDVTALPLPGGIRMSFTSLGVYTPEGGQTHRIGLAPDIRVGRTIQGIAEGRDELIEAAVSFILSNP